MISSLFQVYVWFTPILDDETTIVDGYRNPILAG